MDSITMTNNAENLPIAKTGRIYQFLKVMPVCGILCINFVLCIWFQSSAAVQIGSSGMLCSVDW